MADADPSTSSQIHEADSPERLTKPTDGEHATPRLPFPVVGMGSSAGGLEAFGEFFKVMRPDSGMAFVLIQHLPPDRDSMLVEILSKRTSMPVAQVEEGLAVKANHVYIIRPGHTLTIRDGTLHLGEPVEKPGHRRPVDDFFRSLAAEQRERAICVIMSGMGSNGTAGAGFVKAVGGLCIAQDPETAKFPSMPKSLIDSGLADFVLRPEDIPDVLIRYATHPYTRGTPTADTVAHRERQALNEAITVIRARSRHDFSGYKKPTLVRRIQRRMGLTQITRIEEYVRILRQNPGEVSALVDDLMIHVTGFFRDAEAWESLRQKVILPLVADREDNSVIRAWVTACSSGEEAYTLAILFVEAAELAGKHFDIKIFATDTAERSLSHARSGIYPGGIESEITPARLDRFFEKNDSTFRVKKELRELVVFAPQNVLQDPPFSRLDICTCRNLLIYLEPEIQRRVLALLHFGIREGGALLLGTSETIPHSEGIFEPIDKKHRLYKRIGPTRHGAVDFPLPRNLSGLGTGDQAVARQLPRASIAQLTAKALLDRYTPPSVVVDRQEHIVYFHGNTDRYLDQPRGEPTRELTALLKESIRGTVRTAVHKAIEENETVRVRDGLIETTRGRCRLEITVAPLEPNPTSSYFLISFNEILDPGPAASAATEQGPQRHHEMEDELHRVRDELQNTVEELQSSNEEMKASNEEITSINEELQSTNEELETSKEELQSLNEELTTVNAQLQTKMEELEGMTSDLSSLLSSTDIAVVFLDTQLRIRRFTPAVKDLMDLIPTDVGRPLNDLARKFDDSELLSEVAEVLAKLVPLEKEVTSESGRTYIRRALPYRTTDNRIGGVVVTFVDISGRTRAEAALRESEQRHRLILESIKEYAIVMLDKGGHFATWSPGAERLIGHSATEAVGMHWADIFTPEDKAAGLPEKQMRLARERHSTSEERWCIRKDGSRFWCSGVVSAVTDREGSLLGYVKVLRDNTERKRVEEDLLEAKRIAEDANEAKDQFLANVSHELRTPLSAMLLWANMLESDGNTDLAHLREGLNAIKRSAEAQKELIEDLLDTSRISAGKLRLELRDIELISAIHTAVEAIQPTARAKSLAVQVTLDPNVGVVRADPHRLQQVVWNLLSNAVKFTPAGGRITLQMVRRGDEVEIAVADTGKGINEDFLPHVFDRFGQAESSQAGATGGLGLGLTISKQLVELHHGTLAAQSAGAGRGSTFTIRLPLPRTAAATSDGEQPDSPPTLLDKSLAGFHILLVEDEPETRNALVTLLHSAGAEVIALDTVSSALAEFKRRRPDLIVSDIGLPDGDGYELLKAIRAKERRTKGNPVPALALTAYAQEQDRRRAATSGFQQYLAKPIEPLRLVTALARLLSQP
jgi:two-component system CheB/CheR fusion protein